METVWADPEAIDHQRKYNEHPQAVAAAVDMESALSTLALHFNCRLLSRNCNEVLKSKCAVLLEAAAWVPVQTGTVPVDVDGAR